MKLEVKKVESQSLPGFKYISGLYRGRKGGPFPQGRNFRLLRRPIPPFLILILLISPILPPTTKESLDIPITLTGK